MSLACAWDVVRKPWRPDANAMVTAQPAQMVEIEVSAHLIQAIDYWRNAPQLIVQSASLYTSYAGRQDASRLAGTTHCQTHVA